MTSTRLRRRGVYVASALTILRAYVVAGRPFQVDPLGSFEEWSRLVRNALIWVGCEDPVSTIEQARACDPRLDELNGVMTQWAEVIGTDRVSVRQVIAKATEKRVSPGFGVPADFVHPDFYEAFMTVAAAGGIINSRRLGRWLAANQKRIVAGRSFEAWGLIDGIATWKLSAAPAIDRMSDERREAALLIH